NCKEKASFFLIVFFNLLILCQKLLIERYIIISLIKGGSILFCIRRDFFYKLTLRTGHKHFNRLSSSKAI
ncbi:hypothetical protein X973_16025, partial [Piscirickettsia salmonis]